MPFYRHVCSKCGHESEDQEILRVCPECSCSDITNDIPVNEFSDEFMDEGEILEDFSEPWREEEIDGF